MNYYDMLHRSTALFPAGHRLLSALMMSAAFCCLVACSTPLSIHKEHPATQLKWPAEPNPAKIEWVKAIAGAQDAGIQKSFWRKALEFVIGKERQNIVRPHGVLYDAAERLFIADPGAGVVHVMDAPNGQYILIGAEDGSPLRTPIGLAEDDRNHLYISDSTTGMVYCYDLSVRTLVPLLKHKLGRPTGIVYNKANKLLYIIDTLNGRVHGVDDTGSEKISFGSAGEADGSFNHPTDIAVDGRGQLYIVDPLNYKIKLFSPDGKLLGQFGTAGDSAADLNKPKGVAVDREGHIYVSDALTDSVKIFDDSGRLLLTFGSRGIGPGDFWMPSGIAIDDHDYIFVTDTYNQRVQVFRYLPELSVK